MSDIIAYRWFSTLLDLTKQKTNKQKKKKKKKKTTLFNM